MSRKKVEFQSEEFVYAATLKVQSDRLRMDNFGRIVEQPELLASFNDLVDAVSEAAKSKVSFGEICIVEGAYIVDIRCVGDLIERGAEIKALFEKFNSDIDRLELNAKKPEPTSHSACGVSTPSLEVLEAALKIDEAKHTISILVDGEHEIKMCAPTRDAITALPPREKKSRKVDGEITGMGWGDDNAFRIEVGKGSMYLVHGLEIDEALNLVRKRIHISGIATWDRDSYVLDQPCYGGVLAIA